VEKRSIEIAICDEQTVVAVDADRVRGAIGSILADASMGSAEISLAIVDDPTIGALHHKYLGHDGPTDVLSFVLSETDRHLIGEVVVSAETAATTAGEYGWDPASELLLYVIHGTLHLVGYDDAVPEAAEEMRRQEAHYLRQVGVTPKTAKTPNMENDTGPVVTNGVTTGKETTQGES